MLVIGHRGAAGVAPENTMESLRAGLDADADILEFDVQLTKDKVPVVIHDGSLFRTHRDLGMISRMTLEELQKRTKGTPVPTLTEVLDEFAGKILLNIEVKARGSGAVVGNLLKKRYIKHASDWDNYLLSSFSVNELLALRRISTKANLALVHDENPFLFIAIQRKIKLCAVGFHRLYINRLALEIAKKAGLFTYAYTVNRPHTALILDRYGLDGIVTNYPDTILSEINKHSER